MQQPHVFAHHAVPVANPVTAVLHIHIQCVNLGVCYGRPGYRSRPGAASTSEPLEPAAAPKDDTEHDPQRAAKKAKVDDLWRKLNSGSNGAASSSSSASAKKPLSLAQLCKPADKSKQKADAVRVAIALLSSFSTS
jgi:hypothetical protein